MLIEQGGGGHAVHIVVAEDHDGLALVDGPQDARAGLVHVGQEHGVAQLLLARQQCQRLGGVGDAPGSEDASQQTGLLLLGRKDRAVFLLAPRPIVHALVFQLFGVLLGDGGGQLLQGRTVNFFGVPSPVGHRISSPARPSLASIPCSAAISLETSSAMSDKSLS